MRGFSLVELSIVLVILGMLTGGVVAGKSLIRASEIRSISADTQRYQTAILAFRTQYAALPGDMNNATRYWGSVTSSGQTCPNGLGTGTETCDGDGDNIIYCTSGVYYESVRAWQHLSNAGLIEGRFTGVQGTVSPWTTIGVNLPPGRISSSGYSIVSYGDTRFSTMVWNAEPIVPLAIFFGTIGDVSRGPVLTPTEAWKVDNKLDDGKPDVGFVRGGPVDTNCMTSTSSPSAYNITNQPISCSLAFRIIE